MKNRRITLSECLTTGAVVLALMAVLPLLGVTLFVLRFVLLALALVALVGGLILFASSWRFRRRFRAAMEPRYDYKGLHLSADVGLDPSHSWALVEPDGTFVGVDDLAAACLGPVERVDLPQAGRRVHRGETLFTLDSQGRELPVPSPVTGTVIARNEALTKDPRRVNRDPFGLGWITRIRADDPNAERRRLRRGSRAREFFRQEVDRLVGILATGSPTMTSMPDGGVIVDDLHCVIDDDAWEELREGFFSAGAR